MLLNIPQCTGQHCPPTSITSPKTPTVPRLRIPELDEKSPFSFWWGRPLLAVVHVAVPRGSSAVRTLLRAGLLSGIACARVLGP